MQKQAEHFGAEFLLGEVASLKKSRNTIQRRNLGNNHR